MHFLSKTLICTVLLFAAGEAEITTALARASRSSQAAFKADSHAKDGVQRSASERLAEAFANTWNQRNGRSYGDAYWPDAELVDPSGQVWTGREAIIQTHVELWKGPASATHMTARVRRVQALSANFFIVDIDTAAVGFSPPPPGAPDGIVRTRLKHVVEKRNGQWKILASQNTFVAAAPSQR